MGGREDAPYLTLPPKVESRKFSWATTQPLRTHGELGGSPDGADGGVDVDEHLAVQLSPEPRALGNA